MARKKIPESTQTNVLLKSRRRCAMCFGLNRDTALKAGQIAHLDQANSNNDEDNLVFLCLVHHDEYDSSTSQRKGYTSHEVRAFRTELYAILSEAMNIPVQFGSVIVPAGDLYGGTYVRVGTTNASAEISMTQLSDSIDGRPRYAVSGYALWGEDRERGPNIGDFSFVGEVNGNIIDHYETIRDRPTYSIRLTMDSGKLSVVEENWVGRYGLNVMFDGKYEKVN